MCSCLQAFSGNAFIMCSPIPGKYCINNFFLSSICLFRAVAIRGNPCNPSPCGSNSQCRDVNGQAVCSCVPGYLGSPPTCRPECITSSECSLNLACVNQKCIDPCPGTCGINSVCQVVNHNPICSCKPGFSGDPFTICSPIRKKQNFQNIPLYLIICAF